MAIWYTGWTPIDPVLSVFVSLLILRIVRSLLKTRFIFCWKLTSDNASSTQIAEYLQISVPGVWNVSHIKFWSLTPVAYFQVQPMDETDIRTVVM